jgi:hypothetical protein
LVEQQSAVISRMLPLLDVGKVKSLHIISVPSLPNAVFLFYSCY